MRPQPHFNFSSDHRQHREYDYQPVFASDIQKPVLAGKSGASTPSNISGRITSGRRIVAPLPDVRALPGDTRHRLRLVRYFLPEDRLPNRLQRPPYVVGEAALVLGDGFHILARVLRPDTGPKLLEVLEVFDTLLNRHEALIFDDGLLQAIYRLMAGEHVAAKAQRYTCSPARRN